MFGFGCTFFLQNTQDRSLYALRISSILVGKVTVVKQVLQGRTRRLENGSHSEAVNGSDLGVFKYLSCFDPFNRKFSNLYKFSQVQECQDNLARGQSSYRLCAL